MAAAARQLSSRGVAQWMSSNISTHGRSRAAVAGEIGQRRRGTAPARGVVHRVEDRALILALLQAEQVADWYFVISRDESGFECAAERCLPRRIFGIA